MRQPDAFEQALRNRLLTIEAGIVACGAQSAQDDTPRGFFDMRSDIRLNELLRGKALLEGIIEAAGATQTLLDALGAHAAPGVGEDGVGCCPNCGHPMSPGVLLAPSAGAPTAAASEDGNDEAG